MSSLSDRLLTWYAQHSRQLPWRGQADPYAVWVSEIMLQQTRVETVIPYYQYWMELFPSIQALAQASQQDVLAAWEGLGYYSRARNLQRAAQLLMAEYNGEMPTTVEGLLHLPGVGRYTAAAIASIAFNAPAAALDGNIRRVMARVFNVELPARSPEGERRLWELAQQNLPAENPGDYNQALMDLGSAICTPRAPACRLCPLQEMCQAHLFGIEEQRPVLERKPEVPHYLVTAAVIHRKGLVLIDQRPQNGLLGGMWEFPGGKLKKGEDLPTCLRREIEEELGAQVEVGAELGIYKHGYTHFHVTLHAFHCTVVSGEPHPIEASALKWVHIQELSSYPMGKIDRRISRDLLNWAYLNETLLE